MASLSNAAVIEQRVQSIDVLRGSIVLTWLLAILFGPVLHEVSTSSLAQSFAAQLSPSFWDGVTVFDLVLPMFLFIAGASIVPAFRRRRAAGQSNLQFTWRILRRVALLSLIGILCEGGLFEHWPYLRFAGSFQRIAVCYAVVAALDLTTAWQIQAGLMGFLLVDYAAILAFSVIGGRAAAYSFESNAVATVDQLFFPGSKYFGTWDSQGILTTIPSLAVTIAGLLAGRALATVHGSTYRSLGLALVGFVLINAGILADNVIPVNPYLWTLTFCCIAIGAGTALLGTLQAALDVKQPSRSTAGLMSLGRNSLIVVLAALAFSTSLEWAAVRLAWLRFQIGVDARSPLWAVMIFLAACGIAFFLGRRKFYVTI